MSYADFRNYRLKSFSHLAATLGTQFNTSDDDHVPEIYPDAYVSVGLFKILEHRAIPGRDFLEFFVGKTRGADWDIALSASADRSVCIEGLP